MKYTKRSLLCVEVALLAVLCALSACNTNNRMVSGAKSGTPATVVATTPVSVMGHMAQIMPPRIEGSMVYDERHHTVVLFGGSSHNDTWLWNGQAWQLVHPAVFPVGRTGGSMGYDALHGLVVLFGGIDITGVALNDTWTWDGTIWTLRHPAQRPQARNQAGMTYDSAHQRLLLFGGEVMGSAQTTSLANDTWLWDGSSWSQQHPTAAPPARMQASMAYDEQQQRVLLFGGTTDMGLVNDTWAWDGAAWSQLQPAAMPSARAGASMVYDRIHMQVVLFAGGAGADGGDLSETWLWNGAIWSRASIAQSPSGFYTLGVYDPAQQAIVAYVVRMENKTISASETWLWNGVAWSVYRS